MLEKEPEIKKERAVTQLPSKIDLRKEVIMNSKIDEIIAQNCLKIDYENGKNTAPIRLLDAKSSPKPLERARKYKLMDIDTENWLIPYVLSKQSIIVLYAPADSRKTFAAWGLAKFSYLTQKVSEVFYFDGDNGIPVLFGRGVEELTKYSKFNYISLNNPRIHRDFEEVDNFKLLKDIATNSDEDLSSMLFIFDSLKDFVVELDMENGRDMKKFFREYIMNLRLRGATVIILHHSNKVVKNPDDTVNTNQLTFAGSQQILNSIETAYMVVPSNCDTAQQDCYLRYEFIGEKRRIGGNRFELTVHTLPGEGHRNLDIELNVPEITSYVRNKKELGMIEKIIKVLAEGDLELNSVYKKLKRNRRDKFVEKILKDYELIFWRAYFFARKNT